MNIQQDEIFNTHDSHLITYRSDRDLAYMKKKAVMTRPIARVTTDRVGYIATGIGLVIGVAAFSPENNTNRL